MVLMLMHYMSLLYMCLMVPPREVVEAEHGEDVERVHRVFMSMHHIEY